MFVILPVHKGDAETARKTLELSGKLGFQTAHPLIVIYPYSASPVIAPVLDAAKKAFKVVIEHQIASDVPDGWPQGPNAMFFHAVSFLEKGNQIDRDLGVVQMRFTEPNGRFLWWEPDAVPAHPSWLDKLESHYNVSQKPFLGAMVETLKYRFPQVPHPANPNITVADKSRDPIGPPEKDGVHMSGVGIYPRNLNWGNTQAPAIIGWFRSVLGSDEPFDILFQNEICGRNGVDYVNFTPSYLISHNSRSTNYRIKADLDGTYVLSDKDPKFPNGTDRALWTRDGSVGTVLFHGCKDDSIYSVISELNNLSTPKAMPDFAGYKMEADSIEPVLENERFATNQGAQVSESGPLSADEQALLDRLIKKSVAAQKPAKGEPKPRKDADISRINSEEFYKTLDSEGWRAALTKHKASPQQGAKLKAMRVLNLA